VSDPLKREIPKIDAAHLTIGLGVLYLFGFIVANVHFGKYELPRIELLRARYVAAALLFILCSAIPFAVGAFLSRALRTHALGAGGLRRDLKLGETEAWAIGAGGVLVWLLIAVVMYALVLSQLTLRLFAAPGTSALYFVLVTMATWQTSDLLLGGEASDEAHLWPSIRMANHVLYAAFLVIIIPAAFSIFLYGSITPELGGGALWKAQLTWRTTADSAARAKASGVVAIVDVDERTLSLLACGGSGPPARVSVSATDVSSIHLGELVSPTSFLEDYATHCRRLEPTQISVMVSRKDLLAFLIVLIGGMTYALLKLVAIYRTRRPDRSP
jgi:hypothetical protein